MKINVEGILKISMLHLVCLPVIGHLYFTLGGVPIGYCGHLGFSESGSVEGDVQFNIRYCQIGFPRGEKSNLNGQMCQMLGSVGTK